jgi:hypothetical protein
VGPDTTTDSIEGVENRWTRPKSVDRIDIRLIVLNARASARAAHADSALYHFCTLRRTRHVLNARASVLSGDLCSLDPAASSCFAPSLLVSVGISKARLGNGMIMKIRAASFECPTHTLKKTESRLHTPIAQAD